MNKNEDRLTENMIWSCVWGMGQAVPMPGIILKASFAATSPEQKQAPINSKKAPKGSNRISGAAQDPYEVASAFAASFAPIEKLMRNERICFSIKYSSV